MIRAWGVASVSVMAALLLLRLSGPWLAVERFAASRTSPEALRLRDSERAGHAPAARAFLGMGAVGDPDASCNALRQVVATLRPDTPPSEITQLELLRYLEDGHPPATRAGPLWRITAGSVERTRRWLLAQTDPVSPGEVVRVSTVEAGGTSLGVLSAHNLVKELTLSGRRHSPDHLPVSMARLAESISPWRVQSRLPAGDYDRLGPLYHALAALTLVTWTGSPTLGRLAADYEALRRIARVGRDRPDPEKARADRCGVEAGEILLARGDRIQG